MRNLKMITDAKITLSFSLLVYPSYKDYTAWGHEYP